MRSAGWEFGDVAANDEDWASPTFDYLQSYIGDILKPGAKVGGPGWAEAEAQRWREARPFLIAHVRRSTGQPNWDPRGASVSPIGGDDTRTRPGDRP